MTDTRTALPVVTVSEKARTTILGLRDAEPDPTTLALRLEITGEAASEYVYELTFEPVAEAAEDDVLGYSGELPVLVPAASVDRLRGATLDEVGDAGLVLRNPNRPEPPSLAPPGATYEEGTVEHRIQTLLDTEINPMLASHGGFTTLDHVEGDVAYMFMGGGCQGCGLAKLTLTEGIKATIEKEIEEIREVVDITDHAQGENPYYEAAK